MKKRNILLALLLACVLCFTACGSDEDTAVGGAVAENSAEFGSAEESSDYPFKALIDKYGYYEAGDYIFTYLPEGAGNISVLQFSGAGEIVDETADYYVTKVEVYEPLNVPAEMQEGDVISLIVDEITGEENTWTCTGNMDGYLTFEKDGNPNYYAGGTPDANGMVGLMVDSEDAVCCYLGDYEMRVAKNAKDEVVIVGEIRDVTEEILESGFWTHVLFDDEGCAQWLYYVGD